MNLLAQKILKGLMIIFPLFYIGCANVVAPTGGPEDKDPPVVLRSTPPNFSTHYQGENVRIYFDEFVELNNLKQNMLVSPPLNEDPEVKIRGRSIIMSVQDTLLENTTYNFFFGESIVDLTEGNPIPNFQYIVSTGAYVDSLSVRGTLVNAATLEPEESVFVMLYRDVYDSVPMLERPVYLAKTNSEGEFFISNMREGEYLIFALDDMNNNFLYDNPDERIAFHDTLITPEYFDLTKLTEDAHEKEQGEEGEDDTPDAEGEVTPSLNDSRVSDTLASDTLSSDTLAADPFAGFPAYDMYLFQEEDTLQRLISALMERRGKVNLNFRIPADSVVIREYENPFDREWYIPEYNKNRDTLTLWLPDMVRDTLRLEISDRGQVVDSVTVSLVEATARGRSPRQDTNDTEPTLVISAPSSAGRGIHPYHEKFELKSQTPLDRFDKTLFSLYLNDSIPVEADFEFGDEVQRTIQMTSLLEPDSAYRLVVLPGSITDIFGAQNDTLTFNFQLDNEEKYGTIIVNLTLPESEGEQYLLQLLNKEKEIILDEIEVSESGNYLFRYLESATFALRLVFDENKNGKWDTGDYLEKKQPEKVKMYPETIDSRLNWEVEVLWDISED